MTVDTGGWMNAVATASSVTIGPLNVEAVDFVVTLPGVRYDPDATGPNVLKHFDVDFDFGKKTFDKFSQDHCNGQVVY